VKIEVKSITKTSRKNTALANASRWAYERSQDSLTPEYTTALSAYKILNNGKLAARLTETLLLPAAVGAKK